MKKGFLLAVMALLLMVGCTDSNSASSVDNYTFTTTAVISCSPSMSGYPQTTTSVTTQNGITAETAKATAAGLTMSNTTYSGGYTIKQKWTCVYVLTKDYVAPVTTGARVVI